jgi:hypothetical protein
MDKCDTGICDMLVRHHDKLVDDPERLTTDFILELCCTRPQKLEDYKIKRAFQIFSNHHLGRHGSKEPPPEEVAQEKIESIRAKHFTLDQLAGV